MLNTNSLRILKLHKLLLFLNNKNVLHCLVQFISDDISPPPPISVLDPAVAPASEEEIENGKLSYKNAKFVDVYHSDGGICFRKYHLVKAGKNINSYGNV